MTDGKLYDADGRELNRDHYFTPEGYTRPTYEMHPTGDGRGLDEAGRLIRTRPPFFECSYQVGRPSPEAEGVQVWDVNNSVHTFALIEPDMDDSEAMTDKQKGYALSHAGAWLAVTSIIKPPAEELDAVRRLERLLTGQEIEEEPPEMPEEELPF